MADQEDLTIWRHRWDALSTAVDAVIRTINAQTPPRAKTLRSLAKCLQAFAQGQVDFFCDGFDTRQHYNLDISKEYPPEFVLRETMSQIADDLEVVQRAVDQRISSSVEMLSGLELADKLAWKALQPAISLLQPIIPALRKSQVTVITYFQKSASIRVIPYAPVALIGIPFTSTVVERDYLAIPHEMGHYVYWHGIYDGKPIYRFLEDRLNQIFTGDNENLDRMFRWLEEIFADIYGCLIGGSVMALDFQDLALEYSAEEFSQDHPDEDHPVPVLRPEIYVKVLHKRGNRLAEPLRTHWINRRDKRDNRGKIKFVGRNTIKFRGAPTLETFFIKEKAISDITSAEITTSDKPLDMVINEIWAMLLSLQPDPWSKNEEAVDHLYPEFEANFMTQAKKEPPISAEFDVEPPLNLWESWAEEKKIYRSKNIIEFGKLEELDQAPNGTWVHMLWADAWTTEGGQGRKGKG